MSKYDDMLKKEADAAYKKLAAAARLSPKNVDRLEAELAAANSRANKAERDLRERPGCLCMTPGCKSFPLQEGECWLCPKCATKLRAEVESAKTLLQEWWNSESLSAGDGTYLAWFDSFSARVMVALGDKISQKPQRIPDGTRGIRSVDSPCEYFEPGTPEGATAGGRECCGDGHYLCHECVNLTPDKNQEWK